MTLTRHQKIELARFAIGLGVAYLVAASSVFRFLTKGWQP